TCTTPTSGSLNLATISTGLPVGCEPAGSLYDVWYNFTAQASTHTVTLGNFGAGFTNRAVQLYSGTCGSLTSIQCGTTTLTGTGLTPGNTYYVRVSQVGSSPTSTSTFNICITNPLAPPINDECAGSTLLTAYGTSCSGSTSGTLLASTPRTAPIGCAT